MNVIADVHSSLRLKLYILILAGLVFKTDVT